jgi:hypothetical protein
MSIADTIIDIIISFFNGTILKILPVDIGGFSVNQFTTGFTAGATQLATSWKFIDNFLDLKLLFGLAFIILSAEILLHMGFKPLKWVINIFRGSGA